MVGYKPFVPPGLLEQLPFAARGFYLATAGAPHGVRRRRHITMRGRRVTGVNDEVLDREGLITTIRSAR